MKHTPRVLMQFVLLYVAVSGPAYACLQSPGCGFIIHSYLKDETRVFTVLWFLKIPSRLKSLNFAVLRA